MGAGVVSRSNLVSRYLEPGAGHSFEAPRVVYGRGASDHLAHQLEAEAQVRPFVITDANLRAAGVGDGALAGLERVGAPRLHEREPGEPTSSEIDRIASASHGEQTSAIVAIGGGATMDAARLARVVIERGGSITDYTGDAGLDGPSSIPLVAVPTTSGTGSESGRGGLYIDEERRSKELVYSRYMRADLAVVDPDLTLSLPAGPTAATGTDALAQAMGAYFSPLSHPMVDVLAGQAIALIIDFLPIAVVDGGDIEARAAMAYGSLMSGLAMNNADAMADQFFDEVIGPRYQVPHGVVAGRVLAYVVQFNRATVEERTRELAGAVSREPAVAGSDMADRFVDRLARLPDEIGLPTLQQTGIPEADLPNLAGCVCQHFGVDAELNPRVLTLEAATTILEASWRETPPLELGI